MEVLDCLRHTAESSVVPKCKERKCLLSMGRIPLRNRVILKGEILRDSIISQERASRADRGEACDCILFVLNGLDNTLHLVLVELKLNADASKIKNQIQKCAEMADRLARRCEVNQFQIHLVSLAKQRSTPQYQRLKRERIRFRGQVYGIEQKRCGELLERIIKGSVRK